MTWIERLANDQNLRDFVAAEINRATVELDTLRYQNRYLKMNVQTLERLLAEAKQELTRYRRGRARQTGLDE